MDGVIGQHRDTGPQIKFSQKLRKIVAYCGDVSRLAQNSSCNECISALRRKNERTLRTIIVVGSVQGCYPPDPQDIEGLLAERPGICRAGHRS